MHGLIKMCNYTFYGEKYQELSRIFCVAIDLRGHAWKWLNREVQIEFLWQNPIWC